MWRYYAVFREEIAWKLIKGNSKVIVRPDQKEYE